MRNRLWILGLCIGMVGMLTMPQAKMVYASEVTENGAAFEPEGQEKWWQKIEAESGSLEGTAKSELVIRADWARVVSFLDKGEKNAVTLSVYSDFESDVEMVVRYRSGDKRNLCYKINGGEEGRITDLYTGDWNTMKNSPAQNIHLVRGNNTIRFYAPENENSPGSDYITLSKDGCVWRIPIGHARYPVSRFFESG